MLSYLRSVASRRVASHENSPSAHFIASLFAIFILLVCFDVPAFDIDYHDAAFLRPIVATRIGGTFAGWRENDKKKKTRYRADE